MFKSTNVPFKLLQNKHLANIFNRYILNGRYKLPTVDYMDACVIPNMFEASKADLKELINNISHLALCVDAWSTSTKVSYITLKAHVCDSNLNFTSYVLDTREIVTTYTIHNLVSHIEKVLT